MTPMIIDASAIRDRLTRFINDELLSASSPIPAAEWNAVEYGPLAWAGIGSPHEFDDEVPFVIPFCAELIAEALEGLDAGTVESFLLMVEHIFARQLANIDDGWEATLDRALDDLVATDTRNGTDFVRAFSLAQMRLLDRRQQ
jgi:hypothetical protein